MDKGPFDDSKNIACTDRLNMLNMHGFVNRGKNPFDVGSTWNDAGFSLQLKLIGIVPLFNGSVPFC